MLFAIFSGGWREKYPGFIRVGRGISHANALRGVGRTIPKSVAALGGHALFRADGWLAKGAKFHGGSNKKAHAGRAAGVVGSGRAAHPRAKALALAVGHFPKAFPVLRLR